MLLDGKPCLTERKMNFLSLDLHGSKNSRLFVSHAIPLEFRSDYEPYAVSALEQQKRRISSASSKVLVARRQIADEVDAHCSRGRVDWSSVLAEIQGTQTQALPRRRRIRRNLLQARVKRLRDIERIAESNGRIDSKRIKRLVNSVRLSYGHASRARGNALDDMNEDMCFRCNQAGELLCCDGCPAAYHMACANQTQVPASSQWFCPQCRKRKSSSSWRR